MKMVKIRSLSQPGKFFGKKKKKREKDGEEETGKEGEFELCPPGIPTIFTPRVTSSEGVGATFVRERSASTSSTLSTSSSSSSSSSSSGHFPSPSNLQNSSGASDRTPRDRTPRDARTPRSTADKCITPRSHSLEGLEIVDDKLFPDEGRGRKRGEEGESTSKRLQIILEILSSEKVYTRALGLMLDYYLHRAKGVLSHLEVHSIFSIADCLYDFHMNLLNGLEERVNQWGSDISIGSYFLQMTVFFRSYSAYVNNYTTAVQTLTACEKNNPEFAKMLAEIKDTVVDGANIQSLYSYLIMPIQRIPRYLLLLKDLHKQTPVGHPDFNFLADTITAISEIADYIDSKRLTYERAQRVAALSMLISNLPPEQPLIRPGRTLVMDGRLEWVDESRFVYGILFNDALLLATTNEKRDPRSLKSLRRVKSRYNLRSSMPDSIFSMGDMLPSNLEYFTSIYLNRVVEVINYLESFAIRDVENSSSFFTFRTEKKNAWMEALCVILECPVPEAIPDPEIVEELPPSISWIEGITRPSSSSGNSPVGGPRNKKKGRSYILERNHTAPGVSVSTSSIIPNLNLTSLLRERHSFSTSSVTRNFLEKESLSETTPFQIKLKAGFVPRNTILKNSIDAYLNRYPSLAATCSSSYPNPTSSFSSGPISPTSSSASSPNLPLSSVLSIPSLSISTPQLSPTSATKEQASFESYSSSPPVIQSPVSQAPEFFIEDVDYRIRVNVRQHFMYPEVEVAFYEQNIAQRDHINLFGFQTLPPEPRKCVLIVSIEQVSLLAFRRAVIRSEFGEFRVTIPLSIGPFGNYFEAFTSYLEKKYPSLFPLGLTWERHMPEEMQVLDSPLSPHIAAKPPLMLRDKLSDYDAVQRSLHANYKFGVVCTLPGDMASGNDRRIYQNCQVTPEYQEFLDFLGEKFPLKGYQGFVGGLDTEHDMTGTHGLKSSFRSYEKEFPVIFHVSTMMPYVPGDEQQVSRKRHVGNDCVVVVFHQDDEPFNPTVFRSKFTQVYLVVTKEQFLKTPVGLNVTLDSSSTKDIPSLTKDISSLRKEISSSSSSSSSSSNPNNLPSTSSTNINSNSSFSLSGTPSAFAIGASSSSSISSFSAVGSSSLSSFSENPSDEALPQYRCQAYCKKGVPFSIPELPAYPCPANKRFQQFLLGKMINMEACILKYTPDFASRNNRARASLIAELGTQFPSLF